MSEYVKNFKKKENENHTTLVALNAYLLGCGNKKTFKQYLRSVGLNFEERKPLSDAQKRYYAVKAAKTVKRISKMRYVKKGKI